jgi:hypothetical protein
MSRNVLGFSRVTRSRNDEIKINPNATTNPTDHDDSTERYEVGSTWINVVTDTVHICVDSQANFAIWKELLFSDNRIVELENKIEQLIEIIEKLTEH